MVISECQEEGVYVLPISKNEFFLFITSANFSIIWSLKKGEEKWEPIKVDTIYKMSFIDFSDTSKYTGNDNYLFSEDWELFSELPKYQALSNTQIIAMYESGFNEWQNKKLHTEAQKTSSGRKRKCWFR